MKKIEAAIRSSCFGKVKDALEELDIEYFTFHKTSDKEVVSEKIIAYRGQRHQKAQMQRNILVIIADDHMVDPVINAIVKNAKTGNPGDGKIFVSGIEKYITIDSEEVEDA